MINPLRPILTMADIYGPGLAYIPRGHQSTSQWITHEMVLLDSLTGNQQTIAGEMPVVCSTGTICPAGLELFAEAGISPPTSIHAYQGQEHAVAVTLDLVQQGCKVVLQHIYPDGLLPAGALWIDPDLLRHLNNKFNLGRFTPPQNMPPRSISTHSAIFHNFPRRPFPFVLKVGTDLSTGGGLAVAICRNDQDLASAADRFAECPHLIVEPFLAIQQNLCLHYAVMPDGVVRYLGHADQDISETGRYMGNWIEPGSVLPPPLPDIGLKIVQRGASLGYRGIVGIDIAVLDDGRVVVLDLNFRVNGSTAAALFCPSILNAIGPAVMHLRTFTAPDGFQKMIAIATGAVRNRKLIPLSTFDPIPAGHPPQPARLCGLVLATSRADVLAIEAQFAAEGLA